MTMEFEPHIFFGFYLPSDMPSGLGYLSGHAFALHVCDFVLDSGQ
jgi:hypothetical protein